MTAVRFNRQVSNILSKYDIITDEYGYNQINTPFGAMCINVQKTPNVKFYSLHMRFVEDFNVSYFYRYFSKNEGINKYSKKWNKYSEDAEYILNELDERLDNLKYILERDGKVCGTEHKPFLEEIEN